MSWIELRLSLKGLKTKKKQTLVYNYLSLMSEIELFESESLLARIFPWIIPLELLAQFCTACGLTICVLKVVSICEVKLSSVVSSIKLALTSTSFNKLGTNLFCMLTRHCLNLFSKFY